MDRIAQPGGDTSPIRRPLDLTKEESKKRTWQDMIDDERAKKIANDILSSPNKEGKKINFECGDIKHAKDRAKEMISKEYKKDSANYYMNEHGNTAYCLYNRYKSKRSIGNDAMELASTFFVNLKRIVCKVYEVNKLTDVPDRRKGLIPKDLVKYEAKVAKCIDNYIRHVQPQAKYYLKDSSLVAYKSELEKLSPEDQIEVMEELEKYQLPEIQSRSKTYNLGGFEKDLVASASASHQENAPSTREASEASASASHQGVIPSERRAFYGQASASASRQSFRSHERSAFKSYSNQATTSTSYHGSTDSSILQHGDANTTKETESKLETLNFFPVESKLEILNLFSVENRPFSKEGPAPEEWHL